MTIVKIIFFPRKKMGQTHLSSESENEVVHPLIPDQTQRNLYEMGIKSKPREDEVHKSVTEAISQMTANSRLFKQFKPINEIKAKKIIKTQTEKQVSIDYYISHRNKSKQEEEKRENKYIINEHSKISLKDSPSKSMDNFRKTKSMTATIKKPRREISNVNLKEEKSRENLNISENPPDNKTIEINNTTKIAPQNQTEETPQNLTAQLQNPIKFSLKTTENHSFPNFTNNENYLNQPEQYYNKNQKYELENIFPGHNKQVIIENLNEIENEELKNNNTSKTQTVSLFPEKTMAEELKEDTRIQNRKEIFLNFKDIKKKQIDNIGLKSAERIKQMRIKSLTDINISPEISNNIESPPKNRVFEIMIIDSEIKKPEISNENEIKQNKIMNNSEQKANNSKGITENKSNDDEIKCPPEYAYNLNYSHNKNKYNQYANYTIKQKNYNNHSHIKYTYQKYNGYYNSNIYYSDKYKRKKYFYNPNTQLPYKNFKGIKKLNLTLFLNELNIEKLNLFLYKINQDPTYSITPNENGINKIDLTCKNNHVWKLVKTVSKKWINYIIKPSYHQNLIAIDRTILKNMLSSKKSPELENLKQYLSVPKIILDPGTYNIIKCKGDGNCLFRAVAAQIFKNQEKHYMVRKVVAEYIKKHKSNFSEFIDENFDEYVRKLSENKFWGGDVELQAISEIYAKKIEIYKEERDSNKIYLNKSFHESISGVGEPFRFLFSDGHYDSIIPVNNNWKYNFKTKKRYQNAYNKKGFRKRKTPFRF